MADSSPSASPSALRSPSPRRHNGEPPRARAGARHAISGGGTDGNEVLTTLTGLALIVVLAVVGVTIVRIGSLIWAHLFVGLLVIGPVALKLASTGYRFVRYYTGNKAYVRKGPPWTPLRLLAPLVVLTTLLVLATGVVLIGVGPDHRDPWLLFHKVSFIAWIAVTALHVLGHLPEVSRLLGLRAEILDLPWIRTDRERIATERAHPGADMPPTAAAEVRTTGGPGAIGRIAAVLCSFAIGAVIAVALVPDYHSWTSFRAELHHVER